MKQTSVRLKKKKRMWAGRTKPLHCRPRPTAGDFWIPKQERTKWPLQVANRVS